MVTVLTENEYQELKTQGHLERTLATSFIQKRQMSICFVCGFILFPAPLSKIPFKRNLNLKIGKFKQALALRIERLL